MLESVERAKLQRLREALLAEADSCKKSVLRREIAITEAMLRLTEKAQDR